MSAAPISTTDITVYVRLLDEGTEVWRPVPATKLPNGAYLLHEPSGYDPSDEKWEFSPGSQVKCVVKRFASGTEGLVAMALFASISGSNS
jgi:hypothetical protein